MSRPRLSKEQKAAILKAYEDGEQTKSIADRFDVHQSYPSLLAKRRGLASRNATAWMRYGKGRPS